jgi:hypothetical protein
LEALEGTYGLPGPDDEPVVAATVIAAADEIVIHNLRHFPRSGYRPASACPHH